MLALTGHQAIQYGDVLAAGHPHALGSEYGYVAEEASQTVLVNDGLLEEAVVGAGRDELVEFGIQLEELDAVQLLQAVSEKRHVCLPESLRSRLVEPESGFQNTRGLDEKAEAVTVFVQLRCVDRRKKTPAVAAATLDDVVLNHSIQHASQRTACNTVPAHQIRLRHIVRQSARKPIRGHALHQLVILARKVGVGLEILLVDGTLEYITSTRHNVEES